MGDFTDVLAGVPEFSAPARKEVFVCATGQEIVRLSPLDGSPDVYISTVQLNQSTGGVLNVQFPIIGADSIEAACRLWQEACRAGIREAGAQMRERQRRIVLPGAENARMN